MRGLVLLIKCDLATGLQATGVFVLVLQACAHAAGGSAAGRQEASGAAGGPPVPQARVNEGNTLHGLQRPDMEREYVLRGRPHYPSLRTWAGL